MAKNTWRLSWQLQWEISKQVKIHSIYIATLADYRLGYVKLLGSIWGTWINFRHRVEWVQWSIWWWRCHDRVALEFCCGLLNGSFPTFCRWQEPCCKICVGRTSFYSSLQGLKQSNQQCRVVMKDETAASFDFSFRLLVSMSIFLAINDSNLWCNTRRAVKTILPISSLLPSFNPSSLGVWAYPWILRKYLSIRASVRVCVCPHGITLGVLISSIVLKSLLYIDIVFLFAEPIFLNPVLFLFLTGIYLRK